MAQVSGNTLAMAIQAVSREIARLDAATASEDADPRDQQLLLDYENAAEALEEAYTDASRGQINLPPYAELAAR